MSLFLVPNKATTIDKDRKNEYYDKCMAES